MKKINGGNELSRKEGALENFPRMGKWKQCKRRKEKHAIENIETIQITFQFGARMKRKEI